ncbi:hypothetical protein [Pedobacter frigoris]|nr:hypothetical protein [Pedobacter frigoris]
MNYTYLLIDVVLLLPQVYAYFMLIILLTVYVFELFKSKVRV